MELKELDRQLRLGNIDLSLLDSNELEEMEELLIALNHDKKVNKLAYYELYGWQQEFISASEDNKQLLACTGNRCGKTYTGGFIMACHLTGKYLIVTGKPYNS